MTPITLYAASAGFEAARQINALPQGHRSQRLHGHSFWAGVRSSLEPGWAEFPGAEVERLRQLLESRLQQLDYCLLNEQLQQPTDENLARWIGERLDAPGNLQVALQSTRQAGVHLDARSRAFVWRRYAFQSAHRLPNVPAGHKCGRMHGHGFEVILHARQDETGGSLGYDKLDAAWAPIEKELNYTCLNDIAGLDNPTSEMLSSWIWARLKPELPGLVWVTVFETASCGANFDGSRYRIWKDFSLDSAVQLKHAPDGSALRRIHGHTYTLRLHLCAPLDAVMGWTVDFGDVKEVFSPIFKALDHRPLHEMADLADCDTASIAKWILEQSRSGLPQVDRVDLYETRGCGAIVSQDQDAAAVPI